MWKYIEAQLTGAVKDPFLILMGVVGAFVVFLTVGAIAGFVVGAVRGHSSGTFPGVLVFNPLIIGAVSIAGMMLIGMILSPSALVGISSWSTSLATGAGAAIGWWVTFSAASDVEPKYEKTVSFSDDDSNPFGAPFDERDTDRNDSMT